MNRKFSKGFTSRGDAVSRALAMPPTPDRQRAIDALSRLGGRRLVSPSAGVLAELPSSVAGLRPPADDSIEMALDLAELGAMVLCRDQQWDQAAQAELRQFPGYSGPLFGLPNDPIIGTGTRFGSTAINFGWNSFLPWTVRMRSGSYGTTAETHAELQRGNIPQAAPTQGGFMQDWRSPTLRGLASMAHQDQPFLPGLFLAFHLSDARARLSTRFPALPNEQGFVSHGGPVDLHCAIAEATRLAMQWTWALKGRECTARPEELWPAAANGELHPDLLTKAPGIMQRVGKFLPLVYPEGCPQHPAWPSGHAAIAGACATILCAWFADDGLAGMPSLHAEIRHALWVFQVIGRISSGVHFRTDCHDGLRVGEEAALHYLRNVKQFEPLGLTTFTGFFGRQITI